MKLKKITLYDEPTIPEIKISDLATFIKDNFSVDVVIKDNFFLNLNKSEINSLTKTRIFDIYKERKSYEPEKHTTDFEERLCKNSLIMEKTTKIEDAKNISEVIMYDGFEMQQFLRNQIKDTANDRLHIIFTNRLTCTFDESDSRYHGRAVICLSLIHI